MNFKQFQEFKVSDQPYDFLRTQFNSILRELFTGLSRLSPSDNFDGATFEVTIPASSEVSVVHNLGFVPLYKLILRDGGGGSIVDGDAAWTETTASLKNTEASERTVTVIFFR